MKHLEINLTKFVQALYTKNYKTWLKELKKTYQYKNMQCSLN